MLALPSPDTTSAPPEPDCLMAVNAAGDGDWYCGTTVRLPAGERVVAPMPACDSDDGSGALPCRWDARTRGNGAGTSFTMLRDPRGVLVIRYDDGVSVRN